MSPSPAGTRAQQHASRFNRAVTSSDWEGFVAWFTDEAEMSFAGPDVPVLVGRDAILDAYLADPPTDTLHVVEAVEQHETDTDVDRVRFSWSSGGETVMRLRWDGDRVASLLVEL